MIEETVDSICSVSSGDSLSKSYSSWAQGNASYLKAEKYPSVANSSYAELAHSLAAYLNDEGFKVYVLEVTGVQFDLSSAAPEIALLSKTKGEDYVKRNLKHCIVLVGNIVLDPVGAVRFGSEYPRKYNYTKYEILSLWSKQEIIPSRFELQTVAASEASVMEDTTTDNFLRMERVRTPTVKLT